MSNVKTFLAESPFFDPWMNLALEEYLLSQVADRGVMLYLWQNQHTVVIGRNQNAWKECRTTLLSAEDGKLARRLSGGGAVYHDLGNLNFTFLTSPLTYDFIRQIKVIIAGLRLLNIPAYFGGRNDIFVDERKFSGNAFYMGKAGRYHHGTLLVDVDIERMARYLQPPTAKLQAKGIDSVRSRVINLKEINSSLTIPKLKEALQTAFLAEYGGKGDELSLEELSHTLPMQKLYEKYQSTSWIYGCTPDFDVELEHRFEWGHVQVGFHVQGGNVSRSVVYSDAMDAELIANLAPCFQGIPLNGTDLAQALRRDYKGSIPQEVDDLATWLETEWAKMF